MNKNTFPEDPRQPQPHPLQLKVVNSTSLYFTEAVGISEPRANEIAAALDDMVRRYSNQAVHTHDAVNEILAMTNNLEEAVFALITHLEFRRYKNWHYLVLPKRH